MPRAKAKAAVEDEFLDKIDKEAAAERAAKDVEAGGPQAAAGEADRPATDGSSTVQVETIHRPPAASTPKKKAKGRIAGNEGFYTFALCRVGEDDDGNRTLTPTEHTFSLPSVTTLIGDVLGKPANAMAWWGFSLAADASIELSREVELAELDYEQFKDAAKRIGKTPTRQRDDAGDRGSKAHDVLERIAKGEYRVIGSPGAYGVVVDETGETVPIDEYAKGGVEWWMAEHWTTEWETVAVEVPVWSFDPEFSGTFDLLRRVALVDDLGPPAGYEIVDYKTHKPARTHKPIRPGEGVGYHSDIVQMRFYRIALEWMSRQSWCPDWLPRNIKITSQRVVLFTPDGGYLEDVREVHEDAVTGITLVDRALKGVQ